MITNRRTETEIDVNIGKNRGWLNLEQEESESGAVYTVEYIDVGRVAFGMEVTLTKEGEITITPLEAGSVGFDSDYYRLASSVLVRGNKTFVRAVPDKNYGEDGRSPTLQLEVTQKGIALEGRQIVSFPKISSALGSIKKRA